MLKPYLQKLMAKPHLTREESESAMSVILDNADPHQTAAFLMILRFRGEVADEVVGMAAALQKRAIPVNLQFPVLDIVGTGGDLANTVNISTGSAILAAACGLPIAKHGNRSVSSKSGSADVVEEFGIDLESSPDELQRYLEEVGIAFMYAPHYNPSLSKLSTIRRGLKLPTIINSLGPLLNPANAEYSLIGVANESTLKLMSKVILQLSNKKRTLLFHGCGLDELTTLGKVKAYDIKDGEATYLEIDPCTLGFTTCRLEELQGGNAQLNASILKEVFAGKKGAVADALILNAGAAVWIFGKAPSLAEGVEVARSVLEKGAALNVLDKWSSLSRQLKLQRNL
ncbi:MAG: anthranilate phosphoribosyltransferase [Parachlamydiaceae bacterium]|nr:anthranilate phosphoribosyltransferase [Parachlamydiaceae bacterium]